MAGPRGLAVLVAAALVLLPACTTPVPPEAPAAPTTTRPPSASPTNPVPTEATEATPIPVANPSVRPAGRWVATSRPPIAPRYDALTMSAGGDFFVLGGLDGRTGRPLPDGARYDPVKDAWTRLPGFGSAFGLVTSHSSAALVGDHLYVISPRDRALHGPDGSGGDASVRRDFAVLDLGTLAWTRLPAPPEAGVPARARLVTAAGIVFAFGEGDVADGAGEGDFTGRDYAYDSAASTWTELPAAPLPAGRYRRVAALDDVHVLVQNSAGSAILDLATRTWRTTDVTVPTREAAGDGDTDPRPSVVDGQALWAVSVTHPDESWTDAILACRFAGVAGATADGCTLTGLQPYQEQVETTPGGLVAGRSSRASLVLDRDPVVTSSAVQAWFQLYEPAGGALLTVPALPGAGASGSAAPGFHAALLTGGSDSVLACFGAAGDPESGHARQWRTGCHLLRLATS